MGCGPWGRRELDTAEQLTCSRFHSVLASSTFHSNCSLWWHIWAPTSTPNSLARHRTPLRTSALETHVGYVRRAADREWDWQKISVKTWVRVRRRKLDGFPNLRSPQRGFVPPWEIRHSQAQNTKPRRKRRNWETVSISVWCLLWKRRSLLPPGPWKVQEVQNHLKDGVAECRHSVIKRQPFRDFPVVQRLRIHLAMQRTWGQSLVGKQLIRSHAPQGN